MSSSKQPQKVEPFESIRTHLEKNTMPDAQYIQRHIDNLISHNEAIMDNWNLTSAKSSSTSTSNSAVNDSHSPCKPISPSSSSSRPQSKTSTNDITHAQVSTDERTSSSSSQGSRKDQSAAATSNNWPPASATNQRQPAVRTRKRWSTTALVGLQQLRQQHQQQPQQQQQLILNGHTNNATGCLATTSITQQQQQWTPQQDLAIRPDWSSQRQLSLTSIDQQQSPFQLQKNPLDPAYENSYDSFRRSSMQHLSNTNLDSCLTTSGFMCGGAPTLQSLNPYDTSRLFIQQANNLSPPSSATSIPNLPQPTANFSPAEVQHFLDLHRSHQIAENQLENAIQNLSLKRREEDILQQLKQLSQEHQLQLMLQNHQSIINSHRQESAAAASLGSSSSSNNISGSASHLFIGGLNNYELLNQQLQQTIEDNSLSTTSSSLLSIQHQLNQHNQSPLNIAHHRGKPSKSVSPPRSRGTLEKLNEVVAVDQQHEQQKHEQQDKERLNIIPSQTNKLQTTADELEAVGDGQTKTKMDELSILKQQLLQQSTAIDAASTDADTGTSNTSSMASIAKATTIQQIIAPESLPLKKRKISEPNMRYRLA